ncbi:1,4-dihydroxy-2-naphthoyl-CoA hydrolase [Phycisphaerae bacterium RAS1]|nr:1,4-dihydroxy-2-naphthoyl-CoA hydrolase [Phycisphaerae bacterium RAS1]
MGESCFNITRRVAFSETDLAGVMHFSNYYRWMEDIEHAFWRSLGMSIVQDAHAVEGAISWPRVATRCEYDGPARFEDEIDLSLRVTRVGQKSYTFQVEFSRAGQRLALAETTAVCARMQAGRFASISIPPEVRALLERAAR